MRQLGAVLIAHYLDPDRLTVGARWSRNHAHTQGRLCAVYAAPVIAARRPASGCSSARRNLAAGAPPRWPGWRCAERLAGLGAIEGLRPSSPSSPAGRRLQRSALHRETRRYLRAFADAAEQAGTALDLYNAVLDEYPGRLNHGVPWNSCRALTG